MKEVRLTITGQDVLEYDFETTVEVDDDFDVTDDTAMSQLAQDAFYDELPGETSCYGFQTTALTVHDVTKYNDAGDADVEEIEEDMFVDQGYA
jgi:hypothetical protein